MQQKILEDAAAETGVDLMSFGRLVDDVIALANASNVEVKSSRGVNLALLFGLARYGAFVGRATSGDEREKYISGLVDRYAAMLRNQFEDPTLR